MDIAELGLSVDTSQLEQGESKLQTFSATGKEAQASVEGLENSIRDQTAALRESRAASTRARASSIQNVSAKQQERTAVSETTRALIEQSKSAVASAQSTNDMAEAANVARAAHNALMAEVAQLTLSERRNSEASDLLVNAKQRATAASKLHTATLQEEGKAARRTSFRTQNLVFQLNDIGVSLASGQKPALVAIQQGTQLGQVYSGPGGLSNAVSDLKGLLGGLAKGFIGLLTINPVVTATVALTAAAGALFLLMRDGKEEVLELGEAFENFERSITELNRSTSDVVQFQADASLAYGGTRKEVLGLLEAIERLKGQQVTSDLINLQRSIEANDVIKEIRGGLSDIAAFGDDDIFGPFSNVSSDLNVTAEQARIIADAFDDLQNAQGVEVIAQAAAQARVAIGDLAGSKAFAELANKITEIEESSRRAFGSEQFDGIVKSAQEASGRLDQITQSANRSVEDSEAGRLELIRIRTARELQSITEIQNAEITALDTILNDSEADERARATAAMRRIEVVSAAEKARSAVVKQLNNDTAEEQKRLDEDAAKNRERLADKANREAKTRIDAQARSVKAIAQIEARAIDGQLKAEGNRLKAIDIRTQRELASLDELARAAVMNGADQKDIDAQVAAARVQVQLKATQDIIAEQDRLTEQQRRDEDRQRDLANRKALEDARNQRELEQINSSIGFDNRRAGLNQNNDPLGTQGSLIDNEQQVQEDLDREADRFARLLELGNLSRDERLAAEADFEARRQAIIAEGERRANEIRTNSQQVALNSVADAFGQLNTVSQEAFGKQNALSRAAIVAQQAFAIQSAILSINTGLSRALSLPFPLNIGEFARVAATGVGIISSIRSISSAVSGGGGSSSATSASSVTSSASSASSATSTTAADIQSGRVSADPSAGLVAATSGSSGGNMGITFIDNVGISVTQGRVTSGEVEFMIEERVTESEANVAQGVPQLVAGQIRQTNSPVSQAITQSTTAQMARP